MFWVGAVLFRDGLSKEGEGMWVAAVREGETGLQRRCGVGAEEGVNVSVILLHCSANSV